MTHRINRPNREQYNMDDLTRERERERELASPVENRSRGKRGVTKRVVGIGLGALVLLGLVAGGTAYWLNARHFESTDDAFVDGYTTQMAPRVAGQVTKLLFADNEHVS